MTVLNKTPKKLIKEAAVGALVVLVAVLLAKTGTPAAHAAAVDVSAKVVAISDGDTVQARTEAGQTKRLRLAQIDAPETGKGAAKPGQPFGQNARHRLGELVHGKTVQLRCPEKDRYGRYVCTIFYQGQDINRKLVEEGMAWAYTGYVRDPAYVAAQKEAQAARRGLWKDPAPTPPWQWRRAQR